MQGDESTDPGRGAVMSVTDVLGDGTAIPTNIIRLAQQRAERDCNRLTLRVYQVY